MTSASAGDKLTASQEDYLEAIWSLIWSEGIARVRDIAKRLDVSMPSVTGALKALARRDLVEYTPHKYVKLSDRGMALAERITARHQMLCRFLTEVLGVRAELAETNACRIEHALDEEVAERLKHFVEFATTNDRARRWGEAYTTYLAKAGQGQDDPAGTDNHMDNTPMTLVQLAPGDKARVLRITGAAAANRRLVDMGLTRGAEITLLRVAPLGDPIEIKVRGYNLSLRKSEGAGIEVEQLQ